MGAHQSGVREAMIQLEPLIIEHLKANVAVAAIAGTQIYPILIPQNTALPAVTIQRISGGQQNTLGGYNGMERPRIQVDCWATSYTTAKKLGAAIRLAMNSSSEFKAGCESDLDEYDDDSKTFQVSLDFYVWHQEGST
jgi:hypothetical protein